MFGDEKTSLINHWLEIRTSQVEAIATALSQPSARDCGWILEGPFMGGRRVAVPGLADPNKKPPPKRGLADRSSVYLVRGGKSYWGYHALAGGIGDLEGVVQG